MSTETTATVADTWPGRQDYSQLSDAALLELSAAAREHDRLWRERQDIRFELHRRRVRVVCTGWVTRHDPAIVLQDGSAYFVSHGMCPACVAAMAEQMDQIEQKNRSVA